MTKGVAVEVWGDLACFSRPEFRSERVSYEVMTPAAARGILESILYKPAIHWVIDEIQVLNPIKVTNFKRIERDKVLSSPVWNTRVDFDEKALRNTSALVNVRYRIFAHFVFTDKKGERDNPGKFLEMFNHRVNTGRCFKQPFLGCKEFPAHFKPVEGNYTVLESLIGEKDYSYMHYDFDYIDGKKIPCYFRAILNNGILNLRNVDVIR